MPNRPPPAARCGHCRRTLYPPPGLDVAVTAAAVCDEGDCPLRAGPPRALTPVTAGLHDLLATITADDGPAVCLDVSQAVYGNRPARRKRAPATAGAPGADLFDANTPEG